MESRLLTYFIVILGGIINTALQIKSNKNKQSNSLDMQIAMSMLNCWLSWTPNSSSHIQVHLFTDCTPLDLIPTAFKSMLPTQTLYNVFV